MTYSPVPEASAKASMSDLEGEAYFCVWGVRDTYGTQFMKGAFSRSITHRGPNSTGNQKILMCWQHDRRDPIAQFTEIIEDDYGLRGKWKMDDPESVPSAKRAIAQIRSGTINQYSIAFNYLWDKMEYDEKSDSILIKEAELLQMDPVTIASIEETHTIRSKDDYDTRLLALNEETEDFIKSIPRKQQYELRQLLTRQISLAKIDPSALRQKALESSDPVEAGEINFSSLIKLF